MFSGLPLGADCPSTLHILSAVYCRVPETRQNLVSQSSVNSPQLYLIGQKCSQLDAPGVQPILLGWHGCVLADPSGCDSHCRDSIYLKQGREELWGQWRSQRRVWKVAWEVERLSGRHLLVLLLLCQFGKFNFPCLLWGFLPSGSDFHQPSPTLYSQPGPGKTLCFCLFMTSGTENCSYWKSIPYFLSQWHLRPVPTFLAYSVLCRVSSLLESRDGFGAYALLYLLLPLEEKQILTVFPPCIHHLIYISFISTALNRLK